VLRTFQFKCLMIAALALLTIPVSAQIRFGETSTSATGTVSSGYNATYGNMTPSSHGWTLGGAGTFSGSFHSPNFLSYDFSPYLNQSRANSNFQSISNSSGLNFSTNIFNGSHFPGSISYSKAYNSEGNYAVPGLANYVTHGNSDTFAINWSALLPNLPSLSAGFERGKSKYSVYGTGDNGKNSFHSLSLHSAYTIDEFNLSAYYTRGGSQATIPQVISSQLVTRTNSSSDSLGGNVSHRLPFNGSFSAGVNRSSWSSRYLDFKSIGTIDIVNLQAGIHPTNKISFTANASYSDNLSGQLYQSVIAAGGVIPGLNSNQKSNSIDLAAVATYSPGPNLQATASVERRTQDFLGQTYGVTSYSQSASYTHSLLKGVLNAAGSITENASDNTGMDTMGFSTSENYSNLIFGWHVTGSFGYAQNVQTLLVTYMNSFYNYSGNVRRHWKRFNMSVGGGGARTALTQQAGTSNSSESYNGSAGYSSVIIASASYSKSDGQALATGTGLVGLPIPSPVLPSDLVSLFGGKSLSFGLSSVPAKKLILSATYGKSDSNTFSNGIASQNRNNQYNALIQYQVRKLNFVSGYARLEQGFSSAGTRPEVISSYYMGISRWFHFF
jgi:hypothetical protein